ncbi:hypothetical protein NA57DRAFT_72097 [Rhizodiscina lignyota]|uniref:Uncharacterized protein n=1 Tax=Rhizodiscina lignyota TaxID=1504668 RepID=A0A9P4IP61_9PEZI|nr:hypothetical protein NA57DRAFT_72097 [Rhizodiscina lignyota]
MATNSVANDMSHIHKVLLICESWSPAEINKAITALQCLAAVREKHPAEGLPAPSMPTTSEPATPSPSPLLRPFVFTELPAELRNIIYEYVLVPPSGSVALASQSSEPRLDINLLCTNKEIHREAKALFYEKAALYLKVSWESLFPAVPAKQEPWVSEELYRQDYQVNKQLYAKGGYGELPTPTTYPWEAISRFHTVDVSVVMLPTCILADNFKIVPHFLQMIEVMPHPQHRRRISFDMFYRGLLSSDETEELRTVMDAILSASFAAHVQQDTLRQCSSSEIHILPDFAIAALDEDNPGDLDEIWFTFGQDPYTNTIHTHFQNWSPYEAKPAGGYCGWIYDRMQWRACRDPS